MSDPLLNRMATALREANRALDALAQHHSTATAGVLAEIGYSIRDLLREYDALSSRSEGQGAPHFFDKRAADALANEVAKLIERRVIDTRSPAADALLDYRDGWDRGALWKQVPPAPQPAEGDGTAPERHATACVSFASRTCVYLRDGTKVTIKRDGKAAWLEVEAQAIIRLASAPPSPPAPAQRCEKPPEVCVPFVGDGPCSLCADWRVDQQDEHVQALSRCLDRAPAQEEGKGDGS